MPVGIEKCAHDPPVCACVAVRTYLSSPSSCSCAVKNRQVCAGRPAVTTRVDSYHSRSCGM